MHCHFSVLRWWTGKCWSGVANNCWTQMSRVSCVLFSLVRRFLQKRSRFLQASPCLSGDGVLVLGYLGVVVLQVAQETELSKQHKDRRPPKRTPPTRHTGTNIFSAECIDLQGEQRPPEYQNSAHSGCELWGACDLLVGYSYPAVCLLR